MNAPAVSAYALLVTGLTVKFLFLIAMQGLLRLRTQRFRWSEDAAHWKGSAAEGDDLRVERAQAALRNDGESQPLFLAAAATWVALDAERSWAFAVFGLYLTARALHSACLVWPRQPLRNRLFGLSIACLLFVVADAARRAWLQGP